MIFVYFVPSVIYNISNDLSLWACWLMYRYCRKFHLYNMVVALSSKFDYGTFLSRQKNHKSTMCLTKIHTTDFSLCNMLVCWTAVLCHLFNYDNLIYIYSANFTTAIHANDNEMHYWRYAIMHCCLIAVRRSNVFNYQTPGEYGVAYWDINTMTV